MKGKKNKNEAVDTAMCRRHFLWAYWTRKSPESGKMSNDEYTALSAGGLKGI